MGIATYEAVAAAADDILGDARNPTVLAIREHLDGGSPNTILKHLNTWRESLGPRLLAAQNRGETPAAVVEAMARLWDVALVEASQRASADLTNHRLALDNDRSLMEAEQQERREREQSAVAETARLRQAMETLETAQLELYKRLEQDRVDLGMEQERARRALTDIGLLSAELVSERARAGVLEDRLLAQREAETIAQDALLIRIDKLTQDLKRAITNLNAVETRHTIAEAGRTAAESRSAELTGRVKGLESSNVTLATQLKATRGDMAKLAAKRVSLAVAKRPGKKKL